MMSLMNLKITSQIKVLVTEFCSKYSVALPAEIQSLDQMEEEGEAAAVLNPEQQEALNKFTQIMTRGVTMVRTYFNNHASLDDLFLLISGKQSSYKANQARIAEHLCLKIIREQSVHR